MGLFDDYWNWGTQVGSDIFGGIYDAFAVPNQLNQQRLQEESYIPGFSPLLAGGRTISSGIGNLFDLINRPRDIATAAYSGLPYKDPSFNIPSAGDLAGGSLRDLASEGLFRSALTGDVSTPLAEQKITNPYILQLIESIGGETLDELADPTNIPGALVGAAGLAGRTASGIDRLISAGGAISGLGEGLPGLYQAGSGVMDEGLTPENFGQGLESLIAAGFGGLSAAGLNTKGPKPEVPVMTDAEVFDLIRTTPDIQRSPEESMLDEKIMESLMRQDMGLPSVPYLEDLGAAESTPIIPEVIEQPYKNLYPDYETGRGLISDYLANNITDGVSQSAIEKALSEYGADRGMADMYISELMKRGDLDKLNSGEPFSVPEETQPNIIDIKANEPTIEIPLEDISVIAEPITPKEELNSFVTELKSKYGDNWRKKMTTDENIEFRDKQLNVQSEAIPTTKVDETVPPTISPTEITIPESPKPEPPSTKLQSLSITERAALPTLRNLTKASPEIGKAVSSYDTYHTELASENIADVRQAIKGVNKAGEQKIIRFLDGEDIKLDAHESKVARELRRTLDNIANLAGQNDVLVGYRQGYFPRKYEDRFEWDISPRAFDSKNKPVGALEKSREGNRQNFRRDFKVLEEYINEATRRISEAKYLGKSLENVTGKRFTGDRPTVEYLEKSIAKVTGREGSSTPARFADRLRKVTALGDLGLAAIYQPAQFAHTASAVGLRRATRAAFKAIMNGGSEVQNATRSGALWPVISHEVSRAIGDKGYMHLIPTMDKMMRVHANVAGRLLAQDALKGNAYAKRQIADLGISLTDGKLFDKVGKAITDKTQFRTGTLDLPLWTHSPLGKLAFQYSSFAYAQAKFAHDMLKHPVKNFGQIVRFAAMGALLGEGAADLREMLRSVIPGKDEEDDIIRRALEAAAGDENFDEKPWLKKLQAVTRSKRIPTSSPAWRAVQNLSMAGGVGIFQNVAEKATSGKFWQLPLGPAGSMLVDTGEAARSDIQKGIEKEDWKFEGSLKNLIQNVPLPLLSNRKLADVVVPKKNAKKKAKDPFDFDIDFKDVKFDF